MKANIINTEHLHQQEDQDPSQTTCIHLVKLDVCMYNTRNQYIYLHGLLPFHP